VVQQAAEDEVPVPLTRFAYGVVRGFESYL
jgi:hypothetical protein